MLSIFICEDIKEQAEGICKIINSYISMHDWDIKTAIYATTPHEFLNIVAKSHNTGLYFLDIDLKADLDGFNVAKEIRKNDPRGFIVFLTTHNEMAPLAFKHRVEAMDYIIKGNSKIIQDIRNCLDEAYRRYKNFSKEEHCIHIQQNYKDLYIEKKIILCIKTSSIPHQLLIATLEEQFTIYGKLKEYETQLGDSFVRIHKNCIINRQYIRTVDRKTLIITLHNGDTVKASHRLIRNLFGKEVK